MKDNSSKIIIVGSIVAIAAIGFILLRKPKPQPKAEEVVTPEKLTLIDKLNILLKNAKDIANQNRYSEEQKQVAQQVSNTLTTQPIKIM